jgi:hypothetical protein
MYNIKYTESKMVVPNEVKPEMDYETLLEKWTFKIKKMSPSLTDSEVKLLAEAAAESTLKQYA